jgi:hypothetical protein
MRKEHYDNEDAGDLRAMGDADASEEGLTRQPHDTYADEQQSFITETLHNLTNDILILAQTIKWEAIESGTGEVPEDLLEMYDRVRANRNQKLDQCQHVRKEFQDHRDRLKDEAKRLTEQAASYDRAAKRVEELMRFELGRTDDNRVDTEHYKMWLQGGGKKVDVLNADDVPDEYVQETVAVTLNPDDAMYVRALLMEAADSEMLSQADPPALSTSRAVNKSKLEADYKAADADKVDLTIPGTAWVKKRDSLRVK